MHTSYLILIFQILMQHFNFYFNPSVSDYKQEWTLQTDTYSVIYLIWSTKT